MTTAAAWGLGTALKSSAKSRAHRVLFSLILTVLAGVSAGRAAEPSAQASDEAALRQAIQNVDDPDLQTRWEALAELCRLGPKAAPAIPVLIQRLEQEQDLYRVVSTLGLIGPASASALPSLSKRLEFLLSDAAAGYGDREIETIGLIETLQRIGPHSGQPILLLRKALKDKYSIIRYFAAHALGEMGPVAAGAEPDLAALSGDHEYVGLYEYPHGKDVAESAAGALKKLKAND